MKTCAQCDEIKPESGFYKAVSNRDKLNKRCKVCVLANGKTRDAPLRETLEWKRNSRERQMKHKYGITLEEYEDRLAAQQGVCRVCKRPPKTGDSLCVDHDHTCCPGKRSCGNCLRGLLCRSCNLALGYLKEDEQIISEMLVYAVECRAIRRG